MRDAPPPAAAAAPLPHAWGCAGPSPGSDLHDLAMGRGRVACTRPSPGSDLHDLAMGGDGGACASMPQSPSEAWAADDLAIPGACVVVMCHTVLSRIYDLTDCISRIR